MNQQQQLRRDLSDIAVDVIDSDAFLDLQIAFSWLTAGLLIVILFNVFLILLLSSLTFGFSFRVPILFLSIVHLLYLIKLCVTYHRIAKTDSECCFELIWGASMISYYSCLIFYIESVDFEIQYVALYLVSYTVFWIVFQCLQKQTNGQNFKKIIVIFSKLCFICQLLFINLKLVNWIDFQWIYIFCIFWIMMLGLLILQLITIITLLFYMNQYFRSTNLNVKQELIQKIIGYIWINIVIFGFFGVPTYSLTMVSMNLEDKRKHNYLLAIIVSVFYTLIYLIFTIYQKDVLSIFLMTICKACSKYFNHQQQQISIVSLASARNQKKFIYSFKDNKVNEFPTQMIKISSTYYLPDDVDQKHFKTETNIAIMSKQPTITEVGMVENKQCFNCFNQPSSAVYLPCGHGGVCEKCALDWFKERQECILCRSTIQAILKVVSIDDQRVRVVDIIGQ